MNKGYTGKILMVDLSQKEIREETVPDHIYENYLSGMGLGAHILFERIPAGADPLGPDNILGFLSGLLTGTGSFFSGRWMVVGKSPLTGCWGDANCGGSFSPAIKRCGYDGIFFSGISGSPVYLYADTGKVEIRDASDLWGMDSVETEEILLSQAGKGAEVACIGTAGEKLSLIAGVCNDKGRMAARAGLGAVMGSKKLKAVVLNGKSRIVPFDRQAMRRLSQKCNRWVQFQPPLMSGPLMSYVGKLMRIMPTQMAMDGLLWKFFLSKWGTASMNQASIEMGDSPIMNWKGTNEDFGPKKSVTLNPDAIVNREIVKYHCYSCPLGCGGKCSMSGKYKETHKPEYETALALGGLCMNNDADSIFHLNELLNRAGMDTISAGGTVAFALECYEKGLLTKNDTDGLDLTWGNTPAIVALVEKMIRRDGIGDILADGSRVAARKIGRGSEQYAMHIGGQEAPMHDGRNDPGYSVHYAVEPAPGRHTIGAQLYYEMYQLWKVIKGLPKATPLYFKSRKYMPDEKKAIMAAACSKYLNVANGAGLCMFGLMIGAKRVPTFDWLNAATGWHKTPEQYMDIGERIQTLKQAFNIKHGIDPRDIRGSERMLGKPVLDHGANKGRSVAFDKMRSDYWKQFGWDAETGKPPEKNL
jgi:aldehyde:ferredoxin oxidoreductase